VESGFSEQFRCGGDTEITLLVSLSVPSSRPSDSSFFSLLLSPPFFRQDQNELFRAPF
jgi:hypothetical protein